MRREKSDLGTANDDGKQLGQQVAKRRCLPRRHFLSFDSGPELQARQEGCTASKSPSLTLTSVNVSKRSNDNSAILHHEIYGMLA